MHVSEVCGRSVSDISGVDMRASWRSVCGAGLEIDMLRRGRTESRDAWLRRWPWSERVRVVTCVQWERRTSSMSDVDHAVSRVAWRRCGPARRRYLRIWGGRCCWGTAGTRK